MAKRPKLSAVPAIAVRTRRAYFDCKFGQMHVRTAFPTTGGFDEEVTLFCLHASAGSSRTFEHFLPEIADDRSVYAPDLPGCGESDPAPAAPAGVAGAVSDLANDLRLRQIDVLGYLHGAGVAIELAAARPELVRRLVLVGAPPRGPKPPLVRQELRVLRISFGPAAGHWTNAVLPMARFVDLPDYKEDLFDAVPRTLAQQIGAFLKGKP